MLYFPTFHSKRNCKILFINYFYSRNQWKSFCMQKDFQSIKKLKVLLLLGLVSMPKFVQKQRKFKDLENL